MTVPPQRQTNRPLPRRPVALLLVIFLLLSAASLVLVLTIVGALDTFRTTASRTDPLHLLILVVPFGLFIVCLSLGIGLWQRKSSAYRTILVLTTLGLVSRVTAYVQQGTGDLQPALVYLVVLAIFLWPSVRQQFHTANPSRAHESND